MSVKVESNMPVAVSQIKTVTGVGLRRAVSDVKRISRPKTPFATGDLANRGREQVLGLHGIVTWDVEYAWFQERGYTSGPIRNRPAGGQSHFAETSAKEVAGNGNKYFGSGV